MATTKDLIEQALRNIGVTASGEEADSDDLNDSHEIAKQMVESWSLEKLLIPAVTHESFAVNTVGAANNYTIGSSGTLNTAWPLRIENCRARDAGGTEYPIAVVGLNQWSNITVKNVITIPSYIYHETSYPLGKLYFDKIWPADYTIKLVSWKELSALPALTSTTT